MGKKVIILCSSPNAKGNTNTLVEWAAAAMREEGGTVDIVDIANIQSSTNGCIACMSCQRSNEFACVINDEVSPLLETILDYDTVVFATPVYLFGPNAQLKLVLDRMFCHIKRDDDSGEFILARSNQTMGLIATAGADIDSGLGLTDQMFRTMSGFTRQRYHSLLTPHAPLNPRDLQNNKELRENAVAFGRDIIHESQGC